MSRTVGKHGSFMEVSWKLRLLKVAVYRKFGSSFDEVF